VKRLTDNGSEFLHYLGDRVLASPWQELRQMADFVEASAPDIIDLSMGAPRFDLVPSGTTKLPADLRGWPPVRGLLELRTTVAGKLLADSRLAVSATDEVLITPGAAGAVSTILDTFLNPGDRVVLLDPVSPLYPLALRQRRIRLRWVPTEMEGGYTRVQFALLARALRRTRLLVVNSPANPTGGVLTPEDLEQIAWWADRRDVLILSDEVLESYRYEGDPAGIGALSRARRRTLTVGSLSKSHALTSARVGWLAGCRHLVRPCVLTAVFQGSFVPTVCQQIALGALRTGARALVPIRSEFESRRRYTFERLEGLGFLPPWPAGGYFFWLPVRHLGVDGQSFAEGLLRSRKVLVTPGRFFGPSGVGYVRLSYAMEDGRLREGLARLADYLREVQPGLGKAA
jgi:aspartate/methionine/tyrosine aminotransferase